MLPGPVATVLTVVEMARAGRFAEIQDRFAPQLRSLASAEVLQASWAAEVDRIGPLSSVGPPISEPVGPGVVVVKVPLVFEREARTIVISVTEAGWLTGLQLAPAGAARPTEPWEPLPYADPMAFEEHDVKVGAGPLAVPGTLSLPRQPGPLPAVVQLPGSGPLDRDGAVGRNKPLKDVAWGLASPRRGGPALRQGDLRPWQRGQSGWRLHPVGRVRASRNCSPPHAPAAPGRRPRPRLPARSQPWRYRRPTSRDRRAVG